MATITAHGANLLPWRYIRYRRLQRWTLLTLWGLLAAAVVGAVSMHWHLEETLQQMVATDAAYASAIASRRSAIARANTQAVFIDTVFAHNTARYRLYAQIIDKLPARLALQTFSIKANDVLLTLTGSGDAVARVSGRLFADLPLTAIDIQQAKSGHDGKMVVTISAVLTQ